MIIAEEFEWTGKDVSRQVDLGMNEVGRQRAGGSNRRKTIKLDQLRTWARLAADVCCGGGARRGKVTESECETYSGRVITPLRRGRRLRGVAAKAATMAVPDLKSGPLKDPKKYKIIRQGDDGVRLCSRCGGGKPILPALIFA